MSSWTLTEPNQVIPNNGHLVNIYFGEAECEKFGENTEDVSGNVLAYFIQAVSLNVENIRPTDRKSIPNICTSYRSSYLYMWLTGLCWIDSLAAVRPKRLKIQLTDFFPLSLRREKVRDLIRNNEQKRSHYNSYLLVKDKIQVEGALTWSLLLHIFFGSRRWKREQQKSKEKCAETHFYDWTCHRFLMRKHQSSVKQMAIHIIFNIEPGKEPLLKSWGKDAHKEEEF